jgi:hypothetical protein
MITQAFQIQLLEEIPVAIQRLIFFHLASFAERLLIFMVSIKFQILINIKIQIKNLLLEHG